MKFRRNVEEIDDNGMEDEIHLENANDKRLKEATTFCICLYI